MLATPTASVNNTGANATKLPAVKDIKAQSTARAAYDFNMGARQNVTPQMNMEHCVAGAGALEGVCGCTGRRVRMHQRACTDVQGGSYRYISLRVHRRFAGALACGCCCISWWVRMHQKA